MTANLNEEGKKEFAAIFPEGIPVTTAFPGTIPIEGQEEPIEGYMVNLHLVKPNELQAIAEKLGKRYNVATELILQDIKQRGLPLRSKFVSSISIDPRFLL